MDYHFFNHVQLTIRKLAIKIDQTKIKIICSSPLSPLWFDDFPFFQLVPTVIPAGSQWDHRSRLSFVKTRKTNSKQSMENSCPMIFPLYIYIISHINYHINCGFPKLPLKVFPAFSRKTLDQIGSVGSLGGPKKLLLCLYPQRFILVELKLPGLRWRRARLTDEPICQIGCHMCLTDINIYDVYYTYIYRVITDLRWSKYNDY